jgi:hypothetical protein
VEAAPITLNGEAYRGGYFPLKYDPRFARQGEVQEGDVVASLFSANYVRPATAKGHTKSRMEKVRAPVDLTWGVVPAHLAQVIHDISYGEWVRQAGGVVMDERFKALSTQYLGSERAKTLVPWLKDVANAKADSASVIASDFLAQVGGFARNRVAVAALAHNLPVLLQNLTDPLVALQESVNPLQVAAAYTKVMNPKNWGSIDAFKLSTEIEYREANVRDNLRKTLKDIGPTGTGVSHKIAETHFALYELIDRFTSRVAFLSAFNEAKSKGATDAEAAKRGDDVLRRISASHDVGEKAPILRTKQGLAAYLMFYGYASKQYNSLRRRVDRTWLTFKDENATAGQKTGQVAGIAGALMAMGIVGAGGRYLAGRGPTPSSSDDIKEQALHRSEWFAMTLLLEPLNTVPFLGPVLDSIVTGQKVNSRAAPEIAFVTDTLNRAGDAIKKAEKGDAKDADKIEAGLLALLTLAGGPVAQAQKTGGYVKQLATGEPAHGRADADQRAASVVPRSRARRRPNQPQNVAHGATRHAAPQIDPRISSCPCILGLVRPISAVPAIDHTTAVQNGRRIPGRRMALTGIPIDAATNPAVMRTSRTRTSPIV